MPVTRDANFPAEAAQLMQAFNRCADGHDMKTVIEAAANMFSAALHNYARAFRLSDESAHEFAKDALRRTFANFENNWERAGKTRAGDVPVNAGQ